MSKPRTGELGEQRERCLYTDMVEDTAEGVSMQSQILSICSKVSASDHQSELLRFSSVYLAIQ